MPYNENLTWLYNTLTERGMNLGTIEETAEAISADENNRRWLYEAGRNNGINMGSYEEFEEAMGLPKFQAPFKYGEEPIKVGYAQPETEEPKKEEDYLTTDMPEEAEAEEEYDFNREALKDYVPEFKNEIKEKFPNARMYGFSKPVQLDGPGASYVGEDAYIPLEDRQKMSALSEQLKLGQITKEQYETEEKAVRQKAVDKMNDQFSEDALNASAALHLMNQAQKRVKLVDGRKKSRIVNTFRGIGYFDYAGLNPALQYIDAYRSFALLNKVAENPDAELSESEQYLLQAIVTNNAVNDTFQTNMAERIGQGLPESMAFMAQFALTGGVGSAVGKLAKEGVEKVIKKGLKNATRRLYDDGFKGLVQKGLDRTLNTVIPGVVGATTAAATQTVLNPASLASGTYERAAGTAEYTLAPDGTPIATGEVTGRMGLDEAFAKEFGAQTIEQLSERAGASLGFGLGAGKAVAKTTGKAIASKVPGVQKAADAFVNFADNMKKTKVGDLVGKAAEWLENKDLGVKALAQKVGWNGTLEEWYEEQANTVLNALFVGDEELSALFNGERQLETFLSVAVVGGATRLLSAPAAIEQRAEVRKEKQNLKNTISDIEKRVRGNSTMSNALKAVATAVDTGTVEDVALAINEANRQLNLDTDTKRMFLDYASARMMSNMWHSNDRRQASKLAEGVYKEVESRTHKQSGTITVAEYTDAQGNKQNVDIIDGVIIRDGGEKIDSTLSDRSVVIRFQDGTTKMVPSKSLGNIVEEIDPAQYRAKLANASARDMASIFFSEYSTRTNKHGVYYNEDGSLDYYHATPAQTALSLIDELGSAEAAAEYAANQLIGLQGAEMTSAEEGAGMSIETQNALSKWQAVSGLLADITAYNAQQAAAAEGKAPEGVEPMENPLPVDAAAPARNLRTGDRLRLTVDNGEMAEATIGGKTADGNYLVDFDDTVTIGGKKGVSHELTPEVIAAMQYVEEVQDGDAELQAEQTPEQDDVTSYKDMVIGRIPLKADGSRNWEAATPAEAAQAINAERDGDFDASIAFAQQIAQNCANAVADLSNTELEVEDPTNADMVAAAEAQRAQAIASMQKTADFWSEVTNILHTANTERIKPAEQEAPVEEETPTPEDAMPMIDEDTPDFVSAGPERSAEFLSEQFGDDAESFIQDNIAEAQKALADAQGKKPKSTNFAERKKENEAIAQEKVVATAALDFWNAVGAAYAARQSAVVEEVAQPEAVESAEQPKIRGRKQVVKFLKDAREADASDNALGALSAIFLVEDSVRLGDSGAITAEEQAEVDAIKAKYAAQGYVVVDMVGKPYHQGMKVIPQFVEDDSRYEDESPIIKSVRKPQINRNGEMVQAAEITVAQGSKVRQTALAEEAKAEAPEVTEETTATQPEGEVEETTPAESDKQPEQEPQRDNFEEAVANQGYIERKPAKSKFSVWDFVAGKEVRPSAKIPTILEGVYYDKGFRVATDGKVLVKEKNTAYPAECEGTARMRDGVRTDEGVKYPPYERVIPAYKQADSRKIDFADLLGFLNAVKERVTAEHKATNQHRSLSAALNNTPISMRLANGQVVSFSLAKLMKFALAAKQIGADRLYGDDWTRAILAKNKNGELALLIPVRPDVYPFEGSTRYYYAPELETKPEPNKAPTEVAEETTVTNVQTAPTEEAAEKENAPAEQPEEPTAQEGTSAKIEDFGEKIGGARKDVARQRIKDSMAYSRTDLVNLKDPDKILSRANIIKYVREGEMTIQDATTLLALNMAVRGEDLRKGLWLGKYRDAAFAWSKGQDVVVEVTDKDVDEVVESLGERARQRANIRQVVREGLELTLGTYTDYKTTYEALNYPEVNRMMKSVYIRVGRHDGKYWVVASPKASRGWPYATMSQAVAKMQVVCPVIPEEDSSKGKEGKDGKDKIGHLHIVKDERGYYRIKSRNIPGSIYLSKRFNSKKVAEQFLKDNAQELVQREIMMTAALMGSNIGMVERQGPDYRNGRDVTPQDFLDTFGVRGVEFGNWVPQAERQLYLNKSYDAIMDLCKVVGISPKAFSLGGRLALAFGSRGKSRALAHYEPLKEVINLTRMKGAGSLAHEWFHALDNYLSRQVNGNVGSMTTRDFRTQRSEVAQEFRNFVHKMGELAYSRRSSLAGPYWYDVWERAARLFESYVYNKLAEQNIESPLLVVKDTLYDESNPLMGESGQSAWPYPSAEENEEMKPFFDTLFGTIQEREENGKAVIYQIEESDLNTAEAKMSTEEVLDLVKAAGIEVEIATPESISAEEQEIIAKAKANGTYLKAPNGKPTNLTPRQWVQVRTKAFKKWFGDWEKAANIRNGIKALFQISQGAESVHNAMRRDELSRLGGTAEITFDWGVFGKEDKSGTLRGGFGFAKIIQKHGYEEAFRIIETIANGQIGIPYGVEGGTRVNITNGDYDTTISLYRDGKSESWVLTGYKIDSNTDAKGRGNDLSKATQIHPTPTREDLGAALKSDANIAYFNEITNNASKLVDANGEPLVVYHGSNWKGITTFDRSQSKRRRSGLREYGHFFTTNRALAEMYAAVEDAPDVKEEIDSLDAQIEQAAEAKDIGKMLDLYTEKERITRNLGGRVYEVFLNLRNVAEFDADYQADKGWYNLKADVGYKTAIGRDAMEAYAGQNSMTGDRLRKDGIIGRNIIDLFVGTENKEALKPYYDKYGGDVFLVFDPQNIKSASENVGTFDANNPDIRYLRGSSEGEVYGWMSDGKIYLTEKGLNPETPIHEYTHIWDAVCQKENPELWAEGVALMKQTPLWEQVRTNPAYADIADNENALASEVHARLAAPGGTAILVEMMEQQKVEATLIGRIHNWLRKFWRWLRKKEMPESKLNVDKFARMPLKDLAMGKRLDKSIIEANSKQKVAGKETFDIFGNVPMAQIGRRRQEEMYAILAKRRQDLSDAEKLAVIAELAELDNNKLVNAAFHYFVNGTVRLPEDMPKVEQAVKVAEIAKVDPAAYKSPMELINAHADVKLREARIDPDTVPTLSNKVEYEDGLTVYDVEDSEESRQNMRRIINTHFGEDSSPWCLLQGDGKGKLTDESARYWIHYDAQPKRVAFQNGKLLAFFASDGEPTWWDRKDAPHEGIPATRKLPDNSGRVGTVEFDEEMQDWGDYTDIHLGKQGDKIYEEWIDEDTIDFREIREEDTIYHYSWDIEGTLTTYMEKNVSGSSFPKRSAIWEDGEVLSVTDENGTIYDFHRGNLERIQTRGKTIYEDSHVYWAYDGLLRDVSETTENGNKRVWFDKFEDVERVEESNANGIITFNMHRYTNGEMASASMLDENGIRTFVSFDSDGGVRQYRVGDDAAFMYGNEILEVTSGMMDLAPLQILVQADKVKKDIEQRVSEYAEWAKKYAADQAKLAESVREPYTNPEDFERQMNEQLKAATTKGNLRYRSKAPMSLEEKKRQTEEDFGGIWIEDREEYAKFVAATTLNAFEHKGEGVTYTDNYFYAYYRNTSGEAVPFVSVYLNEYESQDVVNYVKDEIENDERGNEQTIRETIAKRFGSDPDTGYGIDGRDGSVSSASRDGILGGHLLRKGRYADAPELFRKGKRAYRTKAEYTDSQRAIAAQAQTLSTAEIKEYVNEVAKSLPEGVKVVVTNSVESGDREHTGWYDMGTDTVYINADMCDNTADVDATIVHELVGHRSMPTAIARVIGTKNVTDRITLYTKLATMLPKELLDRVMTKTVANMDLGVAVDEVLAEAVENADLIKPSLWQRICSEIRAFFRRVLNRGISLSDGDIKYMFWLAAHNINNDAEFVAAEEMRYRTGVAEFKRNSALPTEEQQEYDSAVISKSQKFVEEWVDSLNPLKKLQETVAKHHGELKSWENAYDIELGRASRTMARFNMMAERFLKPLFTAISAFTNNGISRETLMHYMIAKHGLERNEYARKQAHQELNNTILEAVQKVATDSEYEGLSDVEKATVIKSMFADYLDHLNDEEIANALEFFTNNPDTDYIGVVVALEAVPLEDVSGLTGLAEKLNEDPDAKPEEIFTEFAESLVEEFESENAEAVNTLWDKVRDLTNATLLYQTEGGILSQEQYIHLRSMYRYYIPLRGWDGPNSRDYYEYSTSPARHQTVVKAAKGRKSLAEDPIANMANMLQSAVTIVEKNASKQAFVRMALNRSDSSVVRVVKVRYEKRKNASTGKTEWVAVFPDFNEDASAEEIDAAIAGFDEQTKQLVAEGEARVKRSQVDVGVRVLPANLNDHYVKAMVNGEEVAVIVNGSPAAALALNDTNVPAYDQALQNTIGKATRFFARTHTTWAPKFVVTNFLRDYGYGSITSIVKYGTKYAQKFQRNIGRAMWVLPKMLKEGITKLSEEQLNDHSLITNPTLRYFVEFLTNGGETGFSQSLTTEEWKKEIEKQVNALNGSDPKKAVDALLKLLESANRYAEDIPRFAAYLTSRQMGKNVSESIKDAKEITVNFSRHGAGGMGNSILRKLFAFVNAGIQGLYNLTTIAKEHPARFYPTMGAIFLSGFAIPFLNILLISAFGDDDDERNYKYMSEFNNTNRLVLFNPFGKEKGFLTLPISHELVPFYGLGNIFSRRLMGYDADVSLGGQIATTIMSAAPLDFVSASAQGVSFRSFIPSVAQPVYDVFQNRDFMGRPIYRSYDYGNGNTNRGDAAFTKAPIDTWEWLVGLSNLASRATGGDGIIMPGLADFHISDKDADVQLNNPAITQYLLESYLGGALQSASKVVNLGKGVVAKMTSDETRAEEYLAAYNLPLVSGLYRFSNETSANSRIKEAYDHYRNDVAKQCERAVKTYMEELPADLNLWPKAAVEVLNSTDYQIYKLLKDYDKPIRKAEKLLSEAYDRKAPKAEIDELKRAIMAAKMELIEAASDIQLRGVATKMQDNN